MNQPPDLPLTLPPSDAMLCAIGRVATQWGYLEYEIDQEMRALLQNPKNTSTKFNFRSPFSMRTETWRRLARITYDDDLVQNVENISCRADNIQRRRDAVIHGIYGGHEDDTTSLAVFRHAEIIDVQPITIVEIELLASEISAISADMFKHFMALSRRYAVQPPDPQEL